MAARHQPVGRDLRQQGFPARHAGATRGSHRQHRQRFRLRVDAHAGRIQHLEVWCACTQRMPVGRAEGHRGRGGVRASGRSTHQPAFERRWCSGAMLQTPRSVRQRRCARGLLQSRCSGANVSIAVRTSRTRHADCWRGLRCCCSCRWACCHRTPWQSVDRPLCLCPPARPPRRRRGVRTAAG